MIFNHPHLGTEDALLHSRFLTHLFHTSTGRWVKPDGVLLHHDDGGGGGSSSGGSSSPSSTHGSSPTSFTR
jgi:hypothetical protein